MKINKVEFIVPESLLGQRADQGINSLLPEYSRSRIKKWIEEGYILVNGYKISPKKKLILGEVIVVNKQINERELQYEPEQIDLDIIYLDEDIIVINKQPGLVVHPAEGNWSGTLLNGLLHHFPENKNLPRAGIVHRLDKDTSGLLVVARNDFSQQNIIKQLQAKTVYREYRSIVWGQIEFNGIINEPIGRHPKNRIKMAVNKINGKEAITHYYPIENFLYHTYMKFILETGRTHQIRVHMHFNKSPIVGDPIYGFSKILPFKNVSEKFIKSITEFPRQVLHAKKLALIHPSMNKEIIWESKLPNDFKQLLNDIRNFSSFNKKIDLGDEFSNEENESYITGADIEELDQDDN